MESIESKVEATARRVLGKLEARTRSVVDYIADRPVRAAYILLGVLAVVGAVIALA